jgi:hypothetical protein
MCDYKEVDYGGEQVIPLNKPFNRMPGASTKEHKSCWDCEFIRVGRMFYRICAVDPTIHIWGSGAENELMETGKTNADECPIFHFDDKTGAVTEEDHKKVEDARKIHREVSNNI